MAGRHGHQDIVEFLIQKKASSLKQDNHGGTVLHHAVEQGHLHVLEGLLGLGIDIYSVVEIADNAGRTPIFEAVENQDNTHLLLTLLKSKACGGFGASPNVFDYQGLSPLMIAVKQDSAEKVKALLECTETVIDLTQGEVKLGTLLQYMPA
jgi:ankyrin repeat protein